MHPNTFVVLTCLKRQNDQDGLIGVLGTSTKLREKSKDERRFPFISKERYKYNVSKDFDLLHTHIIYDL